MRWEAHQGLGFFGRTVEGDKDKARWKQVVDLDVAVAAVGDILDAWWVMLSWPEAPPFSGGVLDSWPQRLSEGLAEARREWAAVLDFQRWQYRKKLKEAKRRG